MADPVSAPLPIRMLLRIPVPWVFLLAYYFGVALKHVMPQPAIPAGAQHLLRVTGIGLWLLAFVIAGWPLLLFLGKRTTTTPGNISKALVCAGPYRFSRNPMYVGLVLAYLGQVCLQGQLLALITLALTIVYVQGAVIPLEESRLRATFGEAYEQYCARVRRWV